MTSPSYPNPWLHKGAVFESEHIGEAFGFVYLITNLVTGRLYIGRKYFFSSRKPAPKKSTAGKRVRRVKKESDWKKYYGSSDELKADVQKYGEHSFKREILSLHSTKGQVNYNEAKEQFKRDVLEAKLPTGERLYYNSNILSRYFAETSTVE